TVLPLLVSTYDREGDRLIPGMGTPGPRALTFAPVLDIGLTPLPDLLATAITTCRTLLGGEVEIEFALTWDGTTGDHLQLGLLQMRPMAGSAESVTLPALEPGAPSVLTASVRVLGNGRVSGIHDVVCAWPDRFDAAKTPQAAAAIARFNRELMAAGRPYLLIGFGRVGSSDPWLGIPVQWGEIAGAAVIVEGPGPGMTSVDPSQGSHFFHNLCNLHVLYFTLDPTQGETIDWEWLATQKVLAERESVRHIRLASPLQVLADGASGRGVIIK
ncbi:MAG TPA: histidine kinase, partial [Candidatus Aminicenantes bacterium]|nr:histidine kinase [Candidatus Aminicenantes bacterium]